MHHNEPSEATERVTDLFYSYVVNNPLKHIDPYGLDITVSFNPNAARGFGHVGLGVNTANTVGQRPQPGASSIQTLLGFNAPGQISPDPDGIKGSDSN